MTTPKTDPKQDGPQSAAVPTETVVNDATGETVVVPLHPDDSTALTASDDPRAVAPPLQAIEPSANASTPTDQAAAGGTPAPTVDGAPVSGQQFIQAPTTPIPNPTDTPTPTPAPAAIPTLVMVQPQQPSQDYQAPATKWVEFEGHWSKWAKQFTDKFGLPADEVRAVNGNRAALAGVIQRNNRVLDAIAYQQIDEFVSSIRV